MVGKWKKMHFEIFKNKFFQTKIQEFWHQIVQFNQKTGEISLIFIQFSYILINYMQVQFLSEPYFFVVFSDFFMYF